MKNSLEKLYEKYRNKTCENIFVVKLFFRRTNFPTNIFSGILGNENNPEKAI